MNNRLYTYFTGKSILYTEKFSLPKDHLTNHGILYFQNQIHKTFEASKYI